MGRAAQSLRQNKDGTPTREMLGLHTSSVLHRHLCGQKGGVSTSAPSASPFEPSVLLNSFNLQPTVEAVGGKGAKGQEREPLVPHAVYSDHTNCITGEAERYMLLWFSSPCDCAGLTEHGRPQIDLCLVVDTSACMGWALDADASGTLAAFSQVSEHTPSRLTAAQRAAEAIVSQLNDQDRIALVSYTGDAKIDCRLAAVNNVQRNAFNNAFRALKTQDRPHSTKGLRMGLEVLGSAGDMKAQGTRGSKGKGKASGLPSPPRVRRVIFVTGSPFDGREAKCFGDMVEKAAKPSSGPATYTTVVTLGVDLHLEIIQRLSSVPGCRYISAYAPFELTEQLTNPFFHHACPVATNIKVDLTGAWGLACAYGSPVFDLASSPSSSSTRSSSSSSSSRSLGIPSETAEPVPVLGRVYLLKLTPNTGADTIGSSATRMFAAVRDTVSEYLQMQPKRSSRSKASSSSEESSSAISVSVRYSSPLVPSNGTHGRETEVVVEAVEAQENADVRKAVVLVRLAEAIGSYASEAVEMESLPRDERRSRRTEAFRKLQDFRSWVLKELKTAGMPTDKGKMKGLLQVLDQVIEVDGRELGVVVAGGGPGNGGANRGGVSKKAAIREQVSCVVCFEVLEEATQLPCLHTFCRACIETLPAATGASLPGNPKPASKKKSGTTTTATYRQCPSCRTPFLDPDDLKSNFQLQAIANLLRDEDSGNESFDTDDDDDVTKHARIHPSAAEETTATTTTTITTTTTTTHATGSTNLKGAKGAPARAATSSSVARGSRGSATPAAAASTSAAAGGVTAETHAHNNNNTEDTVVPGSARGKRKAGGKGGEDGGRNKKSG